MDVLCVKITADARSIKGLEACVESHGTSHDIC